MTINHSINGRRVVLLIGVFCLTTGLTTVTAEEHNYSSDSIDQLNALFRKEYAQARDSRVAETTPVIIVHGDNLVLLQKNERTVGSTVDPNYHDLKAVSHIPLSLFCILHASVDQRLPASSATKLSVLGQALSAVRRDLPSAFDNSQQRARQEKLVTACSEFIADVLRQDKCSAKQLDDLLDQLRPLILANTAEAARLRIDNYHRQMKQWRRELNDDQWQRIQVIIPGATMPRNNSLAVGYFAKLFAQAGEGNRLIYAESRFDEAQALALLGTHLLDSQIGAAFFDDASRMSRDVLGPSADAHLDTLDFEPLRRR